MKNQTNRNVFIWSVIVTFGGFLPDFTPISGETLENKSLRIVVSGNGQIENLRDIHWKHSYRTKSDFFTIVTDKDTFSNKDANALRVERRQGEITYYYQLTACRTIKLECFLRPNANYVEHTLTISEGDVPLALFNIELVSTTFSTLPREILVYDTFWNASIVAFLRWEESRLFCGIQNPFFKWNQKNKIELQFGIIEQNQFLGPYLDYFDNEAIVPELENSLICTLLTFLYTNSIVYDSPVDPDMPNRVTKTAVLLHIIKSAKMTPDFFFLGNPVTISVKLSLPKEEIGTVMISSPWADTEMTYNIVNDDWDFQYTPTERRGLIMDVAFLHVWAVLKIDVLVSL